MRTFGGVRVIARKVSDVPRHAHLDEDRAIICTIPTNAEATLDRARREAVALVRSGDLNASTWEPVARVYICRSRIKEPSGVTAWRYYCLPQSIVEFFGNRFHPGELLEIYPTERSMARENLAETPENPGDKPGRKPRRRTGKRNPV